MPEFPRLARAEEKLMQSRHRPVDRRTQWLRRSSLVALGLAALAVTPDASAVVRRADIADSSYIALGNSSSYTSVLAVNDGTQFMGGGVLISPKWIVTAGHVVLPSGFHGAPVTVNIGGTTVSNGTPYNVSQSFSPFGGNVSNGSDIGLIQLTSSVTGTQPATRWFGTTENNMVGTYVGFGDVGTGLTGPNVESPRQKRAMQNMIEAQGSVIGWSNNISLADFDDPTNADGYNAFGSNLPNPTAPLEGLIAGGDSGGGVFVDSNGRTYLSAVNSFVVALDPPYGNGGNPNNGGQAMFIYGDVVGATRMSTQNIWIDDNITNNWKVATSGTFGTASNWSVGTFTSGAPGAGDLAGFNVAGSYTVTFGAGVSNHMLLARSGDVTLDLNNFTYNLTSTMNEGAMVVGRYNGNAATVSFRNGTVNASGDVILGQLVSSNGRLNIGPSATLNVAGNMYVGGNFEANAGLGRLSLLNSSSVVNIAGTLKVWANGTVNYNAGSLSAGSIQIEQQGNLLLVAGGDKIVKTNHLSIAPFGALNLSDNDMIITYLSSPDANIREYIIDGRIYSSAATATRGLGYGDNAFLGRSTFDGIPVGPQTELVKYTYFGDADLDGDVDNHDLGLMALHWQQQLNGNWIGGDFNYDAKVDVNDLILLANNWQAGVGAPLGPDFGAALAQVGLPSSLAIVMVPEPGVFISLSLAMPLLLRRRRSVA